MRTILGHFFHSFAMFATIKCGLSIRFLLLDYEDDFGPFFSLYLPCSRLHSCGLSISNNILRLYEVYGELLEELRANY